MNAITAAASTGSPASTVSCRAIAGADVEGVIDLLVEGFPERPRAYWERGFARMRARPAIDDFPRYGYLLVLDGVMTGCILLIMSREADGTPRGNVSSWYVRPQAGFLANMLVSKVFQKKSLTITNISPAPHTVPMLEAQGYRRFVGGQMLCLPALSWRGNFARVKRVDANGRGTESLSPFEADLMTRHAGDGCLALVVGEGAGAEPFVFARSLILGNKVPAAHLLWCRDLEAFTQRAGALGHWLFLHGILAVVTDTDTKLRLVGSLRQNRAPKFFRGPTKPRLGDLADTELAIFGA